MINVLQNLAFAKPDKPLPFIKSPINKRGSTFIHALLTLVNSQS